SSTYHCKDTPPPLLSVSSFLHTHQCNYPISSESAHLIARFTPKAISKTSKNVPVPRTKTSLRCSENRGTRSMRAAIVACALVTAIVLPLSFRCSLGNMYQYGLSDLQL